jgi:predicted DCC family thiol-disulfide oxidoreductase YuxK
MRIPSVEGWVLYDGDCAFCVGWLHFCSLLSRRRGFEVDTLQAEWVPDSLGMTPDKVLRDLRLLTAGVRPTRRLMSIYALQVGSGGLGPSVSSLAFQVSRR